MKAIIIMGSTSDQNHADKITTVLDDLGVGHEVHAASAHKNPERVLEIIRSVKERGLCCFCYYCRQIKCSVGLCCCELQQTNPWLSSL
jgi:phosphoribosylcarboxyaminoimidazole (NCAIR) mutase